MDRLPLRAAVGTAPHQAPNLPTALKHRPSAGDQRTPIFPRRNLARAKSRTYKPKPTGRVANHRSADGTSESCVLTWIPSWSEYRVKFAYPLSTVVSGFLLFSEISVLLANLKPKANKRASDFTFSVIPLGRYSLNPQTSSTNREE